MIAEMVVDLQFGSTGKGQFIGWLGHQRRMKDDGFDACASAWGPNAGHTFIDADGRRFVHTMVPTSIVVPGVNSVFIGPGSVINPEAFEAELRGVYEYLGASEFRRKRIYIHEHALVVTDQMREFEKRFNRIGSTQKGTGAAAIARIERDPKNPPIARQQLANTPLAAMVVSADRYETLLHRCDSVIIEGAQGYSLSVYHGFYPFTTYRDVSPAQIAADVGVPIQLVAAVWGVMRTLPIRVANRFDSEGKMVGYSGPFYPDQLELEWSQVGQEAELTTVTKLPRRIATFSTIQTRRALRQCRPDGIFLNFCNYVSATERDDIIDEINSMATALRVGGVVWRGHGPNFGDIERSI